MSPLVWILGSTFVVSAIAWVGAVAILLTARRMKSILYVLVALSAGALIGASFFHLLPATLEHLSSFTTFVVLLVGFSAFFLLERIIHWHHCHKDICDVHPFTYLNLIGDGVHNFIDGIVIAASYMVSIPVGIMTTIAIIAHEIPQELGDFGVLVYGGFKPKKALLLNFATALTAVLGALVGYLLSHVISGLIYYALPFAAGNFLYIASSDLIPELHKEPKLRKSLLAFLVFIGGLTLMALIKLKVEH